ncbi:MAG: hypothetical protein IPO97_12915 [Sphingomonadales bacterium]|nr:hypothetical protein [Sphingomonadales bacterium]
MSKRRRHERIELGRAHFPGGHLELAMLDLAQTTHVAFNLHIVGHVGERSRRQAAFEQALVAHRVQ